MILHELTGSEEHPAYRKMEIENAGRHYVFLGSSVEAALAANRSFFPPVCSGGSITYTHLSMATEERHARHAASFHVSNPAGGIPAR